MREIEVTGGAACFKQFVPAITAPVHDALADHQQLPAVLGKDARRALRKKAVGAPAVGRAQLVGGQIREHALDAFKRHALGVGQMPRVELLARAHVDEHQITRVGKL